LSVTALDYRLNVSVQPAQVDVEVPTLLPDLKGTAVQKVGRKAHRAVSSPTDSDRLVPAVEPLPRGSSYVLGEEGLSSRLHEARGLWHAWELSKHPWAAAEADQARKITLQRGGAPGWWVAEEGMEVEPRPDMSEAISAISVTLLAIEPDPAPLPTRYKQGTNHGAFDYSTSSLSYVLHALWARATGVNWDAYHRLGQRIADAMDQRDTPFSSVTFSRSGPLGKAVPFYDTSGAVTRRMGMMLGLCARKRTVLGNSSSGNMAQKARADELKRRMKHIPHFYHPGGPAAVGRKVAARQGTGCRLLSDDITAFDNNVRPNHLDEYARVLNAQIGGPEWRDFKYEWGRMPLLGPPVTSGSEAFLWRRSGGIASGTIDTSLDGTLINAARVVTSVAAAVGRSPAATWAGRGTWWSFFCQGDDTLLSVPEVGFNDEKYIETSNALGYPCKLSESVIFLMHSYFPDGRYSPLASRVYMQTVFNEYGGQPPACELFAFIARTPPAFWLHNPWCDTVTAPLAKAEPFTRYGVTPRTARRALTDPRFVQDLRVATKQKAGSDAATRIAQRSFEPLVSDFAAAQLSLRLDDTAPLADTVPASAAESDALKIASYLALTEDERPDKLTGLSSFTQNLIDTIQGEF